MVRFLTVYWSPAAWCLRNEGVSSVLLGASNTDQLMENIGAIQVSVFVHTHVLVSPQSKSEASFVRPDLLHRARVGASQPVTAASSPGLGSAPRQGAAARPGALLYPVNKVRGVSGAGGTGDELTATSSSPDKMLSLMGFQSGEGLRPPPSH